MKFIMNLIKKIIIRLVIIKIKHSNQQFFPTVLRLFGKSLTQQILVLTEMDEHMLKYGFFQRGPGELARMRTRWN